jgi:hypothetical protein
MCNLYANDYDGRLPLKPYRGASSFYPTIRSDRDLSTNPGGWVSKIRWTPTG